MRGLLSCRTVLGLNARKCPYFIAEGKDSDQFAGEWEIGLCKGAGCSADPLLLHKYSGSVRI